jgi:hypothetical protein
MLYVFYIFHTIRPNPGRIHFYIRLTLIEPWWKQLRSLALKGKRFENLDELTSALNQALDYWNAHRHPYVWKKKPQEQVTLIGGYGVCKGSDISLT